MNTNILEQSELANRRSGSIDVSASDSDALEAISLRLLAARKPFFGDGWLGALTSLSISALEMSRTSPKSVSVGCRGVRPLHKENFLILPKHKGAADEYVNVEIRKKRTYE